MINLADYTVSDYVELFTPFILAALLIERALEVLLTVWRGPDAAKLELRIKELQSLKERSELINEEEEKLLTHRNNTKKNAFFLSVTIGIIISLLGMRVLEMLFDAEAFASLPDFQRIMLQIVDVLITGFLLGGGADGIHKVVSLFTTYMDETKDKIKAK